MEVSRKSCRLCLNETEFNISLFSNHSRKTGLIEKILVCLKLSVDETDFLTTVCYKCANNVEKYYDFIAFVKKTQAKLQKPDCDPRQRSWELKGSPTSHVNQRHVTSYVREQVIDADYSFSFLEVPNHEERKEQQCSSPFFSYFSPKQSQEQVWKTPRTPKFCDEKKPEKREIKYKKPCKSADRSRHNSRDLFESQSQDVEECDSKSFDWKLTPDDTMIKRLREKCFGPSDF